LVQNERQRRGIGMAGSSPVNESIEDQIARIDALLNEKESPIDLRIYKTQVGCSIDSGIGGADMEIETQIRGIDGVTTVKSLVDTKRPLTANTEYTVYEIKFELMGATSRKEYREVVLFPGLRRVPGLNIIDWTSIHRTNVRGTIRTVRENKKLTEYGFGGDIGNFGGLASALGSLGRRDTRTMPTPRPMLQSLIDDWSEGGVQMYDAPMDTTDMRYHVMMPIEELLPFVSTSYRGDMADFTGRYQQFIAQGSQAPVYLAIGANHRAKVTGNEDLIWFAKKSGLQELPVFISYQKQV
jgi:copper chaperone CopZ